MKRTVFCLTLLLAALSQGATPVIFDTDIGPDYDDVGAMAILNRLADRGECEILGVLSCNRMERCVPIIEILCRHYGRPDVPIGVSKRPDAPCGGEKHSWTKLLVDKYPHPRFADTAAAPDAVSLYRKLLAGAADGSVVICTVGFFTNLADLLASGPDAFSPLDGRALVVRKVKRLVSMAGYAGKGREFNVWFDGKSSETVLRDWPTPILFSPFELGDRIRTGLRVAALPGEWNPVRDAFDEAIHRGAWAKWDKEGRQSWDETAVWAAIRGPGAWFRTERGTMTIVDEKQTTEFVRSSDGRHEVLIAQSLPETIAAGLESVMCEAPRLRAPAVPLVACNPFFSVWSAADRLTDAETTHWCGASQPISVIAELDGVRYRLCGAEPRDVPALPQDACEVRALTTVVRYSRGDAKVTLSFMTPKLPDELEVFNRPVTYVTLAAEGVRTAKLFVSATAALATNDDAVEMVTNRYQVAGVAGVSYGRREQKPLGASGDQVRCDWGYAHVVGPVADSAVAAHALLAYDDVEALSFLGTRLPAWWRRNGKSFETMLGEALADYPRLKRKAEGFDRRLTGALSSVGGPSYADLGALAWRQTFAACQEVSGTDGEMLMFSKENASNGCMGTVDLIYPQLPVLLYASCDLVRATLKPIMDYAVSGKWPYAYAPHDVGRYPLGDAQAYHMTGKDREGRPYTDASRMPVEECGNMLISFAALAKREGSAAFAARWWPTLTAWAGYLAECGFDPGEQLCTDDFAGHLAHNANLSAKTIVALRAFALLAEMKGDRILSGRYAAQSADLAAQWQRAAAGGAAGATRLAFDRAGTWSQKYNLVWDRILGFDLFPSAVARVELAVYREKMLPCGLPLDSRETYTKSDWEMWCAALTGERRDLDLFVDRLRYAYSTTRDRVPMTDWYGAKDGALKGFKARSVVGGYFLPMLAFPAPATAVFEAADGHIERRPLVGRPGPENSLVYLIPKAEAAKWKSVAVCVEGAEAKKGEEGYALTERGLLTHFRKDDLRWTPEYHWMANHFVAITTPRTAFLGVVDGLRYEFEAVCEAKDGVYRTYPKWRIAAIDGGPYDDIAYTVYPLAAGSDYNAMAKLYRRHMERKCPDLKPIVERLASQPSLACLKDAFAVRRVCARKWPADPAQKASMNRDFTAQDEPPVRCLRSFSETLDDLKALKAAGLDRVAVCLGGWQTGGYDGRCPASFPVAEEAGGEAALRALVSGAQALGYLIDAHANYTDSYTCAPNWNGGAVACRRSDGSLCVNHDFWDGGRPYDTCLKSILESTVYPDLRRTRELGFAGCAYIDVFGAAWPYHCLDPHHAATRLEMERLQVEIAKFCRKLNGGFATECCFDHMIPYVDYINYAQCYIRKMRAWGAEGHPAGWDEVVPFFELAFHDVVLSNPDKVTQEVPHGADRLLLWEFGGRPIVYEWTQEKIPAMKALYDEFAAYRHLQGVEMLEHRTLAGDVRRIRYANGETLYVNYGDAQVIADGWKVPARACIRR